MMIPQEALAFWRESGRVTISLRKHGQGAGRLGDLRRGFARPTMIPEEALAPWRESGRVAMTLQKTRPTAPKTHGGGEEGERENGRTKEREHTHVHAPTFVHNPGPMCMDHIRARACIRSRRYTTSLQQLLLEYASARWHLRAERTYRKRTCRTHRTSPAGPS